VNRLGSLDNNAFDFKCPQKGERISQHYINTVPIRLMAFYLINYRAFRLAPTALHDDVVEPA